MRSLGAGCSTRRGRCSEPPPSHLRRRAARHVDPITYVQVSLTPRRRPGSTMLSRPCQHSNDWQHWAKRSRHRPRCSPEVHDAQPPLSAWATTGNTGQSGRGGGSLTKVTLHPGIPKSLNDETSVVCLLLQLERRFFLQ